MVDPRYTIPLEELVAGARVDRDEQVEGRAEPAVPLPAPGVTPPYGDVTGDVDGD